MFFDAHCDTATLNYRMMLGKKSEAKAQLDFNMLKGMAPAIQTFAFFMDPDDFDERPYSLYADAMKFWDNELEKAGVRKCIDKADFDIVKTESSAGCIYSLEGMDFFDYVEEYDEQIIADVCALGVKIASMTWNHANALASGVDAIGTEGDCGLTALGRQVLESMNKYKIVPDVSHASVRTFYDICEYSEQPIMATHSNAYSLCQNKRNLSDDQLRVIAEKEGMVGINLYPPFLNENGVATFDDILRHVEYIIGYVGEARVCLGCDFDGVEVLPEGIERLHDVDVLRDYFLCHGWNTTMTNKLFGRNLYNFMYENAFLPG